jgi:hypothetical protein
MVATWQVLNPEASVWVAYGGSHENFVRIEGIAKCFVEDPRLRTRDHQRERQSYAGVMKAVVGALGAQLVDRVLMVECDVMPLRRGLVEYLVSREHEERADVLGARLQRVDGTGHPHVLAHAFDRGFESWLSGSVRAEKEVVLMMLGCLTWWKWRAFAEVAMATEPMPVYLELAMPTMAHLLGYRVRDLPEFHPDMEPLGELDHLIDLRKAERRWVLHPCKRVWRGGE